VIGPGGLIGDGDFSEGVALTLFGDYYAIIDQKGRVVVQLPGDLHGGQRTGFSEGLAAVSKLDSDPVLYGFIDKTGAVVIEPQFDEVLPFSEGLAPAAVMDHGVRKYGYIDKTGAWVIQPQYDIAFPFQEGLAAVGTLLPGRFGHPGDDLYSFIDKAGKVVIKLQQGQVPWEETPQKAGFSGGVAAVETWTDAGDLVPDSTSYIDTAGKMIWPKP
jgi:hypothetical protein